MAIRMGFAVALVALGAAGCSTIVEGTSQDILISSYPTGANCQVERNGNVVANVPKTPQTVHVEKSNTDLVVRCNKEGYRETTGIVNSEIAAATFGNVLIGGLVGVAIDAASGANAKYDSSISVSLDKDDSAEVATQAEDAPVKSEPSANEPIKMEPIPDPVS
ncbi:hypothetical protein GTQ45_05035 [Pyruvatibacter mobilis]|jgi:hypothetical protein|uniref:PEGA domain-containing protein n=1 Tax=Pyruvatibacter mobilis TaxID=1712261 RepID=A0A845QA78_9HYPH|nr:hypothetical protein [Pyruvatibacter mobilis]NBG95090.1 hypothetical protein [Pyruvatibacter mobilis]QJD76279.1 hypothetical protein HG718_13265 [Pyruvatibacter mobilis]GGD22780.1 hypothetical protein GCM10011587_29360 [Pyruvatibacter mobilis]